MSQRGDIVACKRDSVWLSLGFGQPPGQPKQQALPLTAFTQTQRDHHEVQRLGGFFYRTLQLMGQEATVDRSQTY